MLGMSHEWPSVSGYVLRYEFPSRGFQERLRGLTPDEPLRDENNTELALEPIDLMVLGRSTRPAVRFGKMESEDPKGKTIYIYTY